MRAFGLVFLALLQLPAPPARADFYQWSDAKGVVHLTDDPETIPRAFRGRAKRLHPLPEGPAPERRAPAAPPPSGGAVPAREQATAGGHPELWWRQRFSSLRGELRTLQDALAQKRARLTELRRQRVIFQRSRDREEVNAMESEVAADEERIAALLKQIDDLDREASGVGVPVEWRR